MADNTLFLKTLKALKASPAGKKIVFKDIAKKLGLVPKSKKGVPLKEGGVAYNQAVKEYVLSKARKTKETGEFTTKNQVNIPENTIVGQKKTTIKSLDKFKNYAKYLVEFEGNHTIEDLYNSIISATTTYDDLKEDTYVNLIFERLDANKPRIVAMPSEILTSYEFFLDFLDQLDTGLLTRKLGKTSVGSDAMNYSEYRLLLDKVIITTQRITAYGASEEMLFECKGIESKEGLCAFECLKLCGVEYDKNPKDLRNFKFFTEYVIKHNLPIIIMSNAFKLNKEFNANKHFLNNSRPMTSYKQKVGSREYDMSAILLMDDDVIPTYLIVNADMTECDQEAHYLLYDERNNHLDYMGYGNSDVIKFKKDVYLNKGNSIVYGGQVLFKPKQFAEEAKLSKVVRHKFVFFDYETIINYEQNSCMSEYSLSILVLSTEEVDELNNHDKRKDEAKIKKIREEKCITFLGYDCSTQFLNWITANQGDLYFTFVGFNNSSFDNFILLDALLRNNNGIEEMKVSNVFYNGSQLLDFLVNGRHNTFDIHKHLVGSLKSNCESFKINCCSKKSFNHHKAQLLHKEDKLIEFITGNDELKEYNEYDVLATAVLFAKYRDALKEIGATKKYSQELHKVKTIGSLIYKVFTDAKQNKKIDLPLLDYQQYDDLQKSKIAGRVEMFNGIQKVEERLASTDVCSLYPFVMSVLNCYYPCGKIEKVDKYRGDDVLGFYYCDIDQSELKKNNLPNIYAYKTGMENKWDYEGVIENYLISNVMIGLLKKFKCKITIKEGFIFTDKRKSCDMFGFLLDFMVEKNNQDTKKKNKDATYNPAMRETLKLLMNSLSGKVIEGLHTEKTIDCDCVETYLDIKKTAKSVNFINIIGDKMFLTYEVNAEELIKQQRPIYLGVFIYDYAKRYMYENSYSKIGLNKLLYTDTDASKFRYTDFLTWKKWVDEKNIQVPHWEEVEERDIRYKNHKIYEAGSKVFGSFEDELEDCEGNDYVFYCLEKKSWLYAWKSDDKWESKFRFKGINENAQILSLQENFIKSKFTKHSDGSITERKIICANDGESEAEFDLRLHEFYEGNKANSLANEKSIIFFENIYRDGFAYVLCQSFRKIVKNASRAVEVEDDEKFNNLMNRIQVNVMMKKITLKR